MNEGDDDFTDRLLADMARLGDRPYAEVGVPMFLVAEDCRGATPAPADSATTWPDIATLFARMAQALAARHPDITIGDVARLIEVLADRHLLTSATPAFTRSGDSA